MISESGFSRFSWRINLMQSRVSPSGSFGFPKMMENSGMMPKRRIREARARVSSAQRSLFISFRFSFEPDSAPKKTMPQPPRRMASEVAQHTFGPFGQFHFFATAGEVDDSAKVAPKRAPDAGLVYRGATAQKCGQEISLGRNAMVWIPGKILRTSHGTFRIVKSSSVSVFVRKPADIFEIATAA